jgi:hypothetical protein
MKFNLAHLLIAFTVGIMASSGILMQHAYAYQPHMENALGDLRAARGELQAAESDKGGFRVQAIGTIDTAISQVKAGMAAAN